VAQMWRFFTRLDRARIDELDHATRDHPEAREAQRTLAREVTERVHGATALTAAEEVSLLLFGKGDPQSLSKEALQLLEKEIPTFELNDGKELDTQDVINAVSGEGDALVKSRSEARRALEQGG